MTSQVAPPAKRQRTEDGLPSLSEVKRHETLWFDDGNIVIAAEDMAFRLHRGIICHHSQIFRDMFSAPHTGESIDVVDGCPVIRLSDCGENLAVLFTLLYDGGKDPFFNPHTPATFHVVRSMLILATKYDVEHVRKEALRRLRLQCYTTLGGFDAMLARRKETQVPRPRHVTFTLSDPIGLINLARSFDLVELLPWPFFRLLRGDPAILLSRADYGFGQYEELSPQDLRRCLGGLKKFTDMAHEKVDMFLRFEASDECCYEHGHCHAQLTQAFSRVGSKGHFALLWFLAPWDYHLGETLGGLCPPCKDQWIVQYEDFREKTWALLGEIIGIQPWPIPAAQTGA